MDDADQHVDQHLAETETPEPAAEINRPRRLRAGDRVAVIAPSGPVSAERLEYGCARLRAAGLNVVVGEHVLARHGLFAGTDEERAADLDRKSVV